MTVEIYEEDINKLSLVQPNPSVAWYEDLLRTLWSNKYKEFPQLFDPPGLFHVGQDGRKGNCYKYHIDLGERPCTSWKECKKNDKEIENEELERAKHTIHNIRRRKDYRKEEQEQEQPSSREQKYQERWERDRQRFEDLRWRLY